MMNDKTAVRYTAQTPGGAARIGTASEIADWLQEQDWDWGQAGPGGALPWRRAVAARMQIQTGKSIEEEAVEAGDATAFLTAVAGAGLMTLHEVEDS